MNTLLSEKFRKSEAEKGSDYNDENIRGYTQLAGQINTAESDANKISSSTGYIKSESTPQATSDTTTTAPPTGDNSAAGWVGAIFNMVNEVIGGVSTIMQLTGLDDKSRTQKEQYAQSMKESTRRFDQTFFENVRQFNLEYALKEYSTRKGIELQQAQQRWNEFIAGSNIRLQNVQTKREQLSYDQELRNYKNKLLFANKFSTAFANAMRGK